MNHGIAPKNEVELDQLKIKTRSN